MNTARTNMTLVADRLNAIGVIPVIVLERTGDAAALADALRTGGLPCAEVTFRTPAAAEGIRIMAEDANLLVGAGTILTVEQLDEAQEAGAQFIVTPGFAPAVVRACLERSLPVFAGVSTATEIQMAIDSGLDIVKFFPAETAGGVRALKDFSAPFGRMKFIPTGGITEDNFLSYSALGCVLAVGGSWMVRKTLIREQRFAEIGQLAGDAVARIAASRSSATPDATVGS